MRPHLLESLRSAEINWLLVVPASGLNELYRSYEAVNRCLYLTREEEAVAVASGMSLAGARPLVVMQQSGVGNCLNAVFSLGEAYDIFFPILVYDRGEDDVNPVQRISSKLTRMILLPLGCTTIDFSASGSQQKFLDTIARKQRWIIMLS
jgi:sulfopyruvate decarboxylase TPP-binding subunit